MSRECIFCGASPVTKEHVFGAWLSPLFQPPPGQKIYLDRETTIGNKRIKKRRLTKSIDIQVRRVCKSCNESWMSNLETNVIEIISNLLRGHWLSISLEQQKMLASWAAKTAIMIQYFDSMPVVPIRRRKWLYTHHDPPRDTAIWIARYDGGGIATAISRSLFISSNPKNVLIPDAHSIFFSIGSVLFIVLSIYKNVSVRTEFPRNIAPHLFKIWPIGKTFIYWPTQGLNESVRQQLYDVDWSDILWFQDYIPDDALVQQIRIRHK